MERWVAGPMSHFVLSHARARQKMLCLRAAHLLRAGGAIAHATGTVPGIAVDPRSPRGLARMRAYKQRRGPFLLLAADARRALRLAWRPDVRLRRAAREHWPGPVTLVFRARPGLPASCLRRGEVAVRVDGASQTRLLAACAGGLLLSSSLNRRARPTWPAGMRTRFRLFRWLDGHLPPSAQQASGRPSAIYRLARHRLHRLR